MLFPLNAIETPCTPNPSRYFKLLHGYAWYEYPAWAGLPGSGCPSAHGYSWTLPSLRHVRGFKPRTSCEVNSGSAQVWTLLSGLIVPLRVPYPDRRDAYHTEIVGTYPPVRISKDRLYVIFLSCGSRRIDSEALDEDLGDLSIIHQSIDFCSGINTLYFTVYTVPS